MNNVFSIDRFLLYDFIITICGEKSKLSGELSIFID